MLTWKDEMTVSIAITGNVGAGKSSLVNALRDVSNEEEDAAFADIVQGTTEVKRYPHPENKRLVFADLPGVGSINCTRELYLKDENVNFLQHHIFIIVTNDKFTENDLWLAETIKNINEISKPTSQTRVNSLQRKFYFVRSQMEVTMFKHRFSLRKGIHYTNDDVKSIVRSDIKANLGDYYDENLTFLVDSYRPEAYEDFARLQSQIENDFAENLTLCFRSVMSELSERLINQTCKRLQKRKIKSTILSGAIAAVPIPGVGLVADLGIIIEEAKYYRKVMGLTEESLMYLSEAFDLELNFLKQSIPNYLKEEMTMKTITNVLVGLGISGAATAAGIMATCSCIALKLVPVVGSAVGLAVGAPIAVISAAFILTKILEKLVDARRNIINTILDSIDINSNAQEIIDIERLTAIFKKGCIQ